MPPKKPSTLPSAEELVALNSLLSSLGPQLGATIIEWMREQQRHEFRFAFWSMILGGALSVLIFGGFLYLVMHGHDTPAYWLLGAGVLNFIDGFIRNRLRPSVREEAIGGRLSKGK